MFIVLSLYAGGDAHRKSCNLKRLQPIEQGN